jgi:GMP synthase-like glutamine amidotransferase
MRLHVLKHMPFEGPGAVATWAAERGHALRTTELAYGQALPLPADFDGLVLMGGPMSVNEEDRYPWLRPEKALVRESLAAGKRILGVCLGAQMIASALGAQVRPNELKEIGWFPLESLPSAVGHPLWAAMPRTLPVFHWHGETFDLPPGAVHLARSAACEHQAYAIGGRVLALQCHLEVDQKSLREMVEGGADEIDLGQPFIQSAAVMLGQAEALERLAPLLRALLDAWAGTGA